MDGCIKQCPSCDGDTAIVIEDDRVHAECLMCGMRSADISFETRGLGRWASRHDAIFEAIRLWNRRMEDMNDGETATRITEGQG